MGSTTCPETCGLCLDDCEDTETKFYIGRDIRDCLWLRLRPELKPGLCFASSDAALHCPETCDLCDHNHPSAQPIPTPAPVAAPVSPAQAVICDDDRFKTFYVPDIKQSQRCIWLAARPEYQKILCDPNDASEAYSICEETCGKCTDSCQDTSGNFQVGTAIRDCLWLSLRPLVQDILCASDNDVYSVCPETCNACDLPDGFTAAPTPTPAPVVAGLCDDEKIETFFVADLNELQRCVWLAARPDYMAKLCQEGSESGARKVCPETCQVCSDDCVDTLDKFNVGDDRRDCLWLSLRPTLHEVMCTDETISGTCPETCDVCDTDDTKQR